MQNSDSLIGDSLKAEPSGELRSLPALKDDPNNIANDIFKHTFVDVADGLTDGDEEPDSSKKVKPKDIFFFYNFSFDLPAEYYKQLGNFDMVNAIQAKQMKEFLLRRWPILKGKKVQYKAAYDGGSQSFNMVLLGKDCPLS